MTSNTWETVQRHRAPLTVFAVALLVVSAAWAAHAIARMEREDTVRYAAHWVERAGFNYSVPVVKDSPVLREGTVLGMGEPAYFATVSPRVLVEFRWSLAQPADAEASASGVLRAVVRMLAADGRAYWTLERPLAEAALVGRGQASLLLLAGDLDLPAMQAEVEQVTQTLGSAPGRLAWSLEAEVHVRGNASFGAFRNESLFAAPMSYDHPIVQLPPGEALTFVSDHHESVREVQEERAGLGALAQDPLRVAGMAGGVALLGVVASSRRRDAALGHGPDAAFRRELARHRAWVVAAEAPAHPEGDTVLDLGSLADLVGIAAEARTRVLLDERLRVFYAVTPGAWFRYAAHARPLPPLAPAGGDGGGPTLDAGSQAPTPDA